MNKTLALLVRALRTESRDIKSHLFRSGLAALVVLILYMGRNLQSVMTAPGMELFKWMTVANWVFITLSGMSVFAVSISEETEHETLGLLRMANIGPLSLLLGKWLPRMWMAFLLISVQFPFTWLTVTLGGVSWEQIWASYLMLLAHLVLVGNVGLLASVLSPTSVQACSLAVFIMIIARVLPFLILAVLYLGAFQSLWSQDVADWYAVNVAYVINSWTASGQLFGSILATSFQGTAWTSQVIVNLGLGTGLFCLSWLIFDRVTMRHLSGGPAGQSLISRVVTRKKRASSTVWDWALGWKDFHQVAGGVKSIGLRLSLYAVIFLGVIYLSGLDGSSFDNCLRYASMTLSVLIFFFFLPLEMCLLGGRLFRTEIKDQTWSTLLTLPMSLGELVQSKLGGALLGLIPSIIILGLSVIPNLESILKALGREEFLFLLYLYFYAAVLLAAYLSTFFSVAWNWAVPMIAAAAGLSFVFFGNLLTWTLFSIFMIGFSGGGEAIVVAWILLLILGHLVMAGITHAAIGQKLVAKGAES